MQLGQLARGSDGGPATFEVAQIEGLPPPVGRYFRVALTPGQRYVRHAHLRFTGTFAARPNAWSPFTAEQDVTATPPGFVWDARVAIMPVVAIRARDSYVGGEGRMRVSVAGLVPIINQNRTPEMAAASLQRFLAEAVWLPTALLPGNGLSWLALDHSTSRATLTDGPTTVSLDFGFGPTGEIQTVSGMRYRDVKGTPVLTSWTGRHADYTRIDGMMIPTSGEVAWVLPEGRTPYWRGRLVETKFDW